jgi:cobalt/nickel transport system permease protein
MTALARRTVEEWLAIDLRVRMVCAARSSPSFHPTNRINPMHIPDGFVDVKTAAVASTLAAAGLGYALYQVRRELPARRVPLLGLGAAFVFAAQMVNFPVVGGTSGHLVGGALIAALLGAPAAVIVITTVLIAQCFLFADGGVTALGANIFNMAIVAPVVGFAIYRGVSRMLPGLRGQVAALAFAGWCSTVAASIACAGQLAWSGTVAWAVAFPAMTGIHMLIGIGEGAISALVFCAVAKSRPELAANTPALPTRSFIGYGLLVAVGMALFAAPFACPWPDGLEAVAAKLGFEHTAKEPIAAPMADYAMPGIHSAGMATALAGVVGALVVLGLAILLSRLLVKNETILAKTDANA